MVEIEGPANTSSLPPYDREQWRRLNAYWEKRSDARGTPKWLAEGVTNIAEKATGAARAVGSRAGKVVPERAIKAADALGENLLQPALDGAAALLRLANEWAVESHDPDRVIELANKQGLKVENIGDLRKVGLKDCDRLLKRHTLRWRAIGAVEGAATGALALIPVAGFPASVTADVVIMDVLCTSIATRVSYTYGFDATDPQELAFIEAVVASALTKQLLKAGPLSDTAKAAKAFKGRARWSEKLRNDHRIGVELERLMSRWYTGRVPVQHVGKGLWALAILVGAGANARILGRVAEHSQNYCQTRWLSERYGLEVPAALKNSWYTDTGD